MSENLSPLSIWIIGGMICKKWIHCGRCWSCSALSSLGNLRDQIINTGRSSQTSDFLSSGTIDITLSTNLLALTILSLYATWLGPRVMERGLDPITSNAFFSCVVFFPKMRLFSIISRLKDVQLREGSRYQIWWIFGKVPKGGRVGGHFNPKIYLANLGNFKQSFLSMKLIQKGYIQGSGYLF